MANQSDIQAVVAAACAAAGPIGGASPAWKLKVRELIPEVAALLSEGSREWKLAESVLDADHITGTYVGCELEQSSTRLIVTILANNATETEQLRTPRTDTPEGKRMQNKLGTVKEGDRIHIWKIVEPMRNDPNKKVRYIGHFETYGPAPTVAGPKAAGPTPAGAARPAPPPAASGAGGTLTAGVVAAEVNAFKDLASQMNSLSTTQKIAVRNGATALGIANFMQPVDDEERGTVLRLIKEQLDDPSQP